MKCNLRHNLGFGMIIICLLLAGPVLADSSSDLEPAWLLQGWIDAHPIVMRLDVQGFAITGSYRYSGQTQDLALLGMTTKEGRTVLFEYDPEDNHTGTFEGTFDEAGFHGIWIQPSSSRSLDVNLPERTADYLTGVWLRTFTGVDGRPKYPIHSPATITFFNSSSAAVDFEITASSGAHIGDVAGSALRNQDAVVFADPETDARIVFEIRGDVLFVAEENTWHYGGVGVSYGGVYHRAGSSIGQPSLLDLGVFPEPALDHAFRKLVGDNYYEMFLASFHMMEFRRDLDGLDAVVVHGSVRGLHSIMFARIMYTADGLFVAAVSEGDGWATYFTNDERFFHKIPKSFEDLKDILAFG